MSKRAIRTSRKRAEAMSKAMVRRARVDGFHAGIERGRAEMTALVTPTSRATQLGRPPEYPVVTVALFGHLRDMLLSESCGLSSKTMQTAQFRAERMRWTGPEGTIVEWWTWRPE